MRYVAKRAKEKSILGALLTKEFGLLTASANYMLNCGLGALLIPISGVLILIKGHVIIHVMNVMFTGYEDAIAILFVTILCTLSSMVDTAVPSVSLEGKSIWIPQSLPVEPKQILKAK